MESFPHLKFVSKFIGKPKFPKSPIEHPLTKKHRENRKDHSSELQKGISSLKKSWDTSYNEREENKLAPLDKEVKQIFLQINPGILNPDFNLESFGIEIISEEEDGYILGASLDNFRTLEEKIAGFVDKVRTTAIVANFWQIIEGKKEEWKPKYILSDTLLSNWDKINDDKIYDLEVSVAFDKPIGPEPDRTKQGGEKRHKKYLKKLEERDDLFDQRIDHFSKFISFYGVVSSSIVHLEDSFGCEVSINGRGLKDLTLTYPFVFEIIEIEDIDGAPSDGDELSDEMEIDIFGPEKGSIEVGVIDSGIMEENKFISPALKPENSRSYLKNDASTSDFVRRGGHGTKVAGALLYPNGISSIKEAYQLPFFIRNLRVLDSNNKMPHQFPSELMLKIIAENSDCKIFNLSINTYAPFRSKHMSNWSSTIDTLIHEKAVLFVISSGNIYLNDIKHYLSTGNTYPNYLSEPYCRIANPGQSSFAITVGSLNHCDFDDGTWKSLGASHEVSAYSRIGTGIWGHIKPDVVEFGGAIVLSTDGTLRLKEHIETATELVRSTLYGGKAIGKDSVGTSYSAPKVTHIAARLKQLYPEEGINLIRAFIAQGARLPGNFFFAPDFNSLKYFGYGIPILERITTNSNHRVTFYNTRSINAESGHVYSLLIPEELRNQGDDFDILIEVSLAYSGKVRRTRQKTKSYLSTWLDWTASKLNDTFDDFVSRSIVMEEETSTANGDEPSEGIKWMLRERSNWGVVKEINRNNSTLQKDWAIVKSYQLPREMSFAVRGHKGWDKNKGNINYAFTVSIEILGANIPIYEMIRIENEVEIESQV
jgi:hypothetical protein